MEFFCQSCKSDNIQRLSVIYEGGLSDINTKSKGAAIGFGRGGVGIGLGGAKSKGTSQTAASKRAAPPAKLEYIKPLIGIAILFLILGGIIGSIVGSGPHPILEKIITLAWVGASGWWIYFAFKFNSGAWKALKARWDNSYLCNRCNSISHIDAS